MQIPRNCTANQYFRRIQRVSCLYDVSLPTRSLQDVWVCRISVLFNQARGLCPSNVRVMLRKYWEPMTLGRGPHIRVARHVIFRWFPAESAPSSRPAHVALRLNKNTKNRAALCAMTDLGSAVRCRLRRHRENWPAFATRSRALETLGKKRISSSRQMRAAEYARK